MLNPTFLLQTGVNALKTEQMACVNSDYQWLYCRFEDLKNLKKTQFQNRFNFVPLGTVEYVREYCRVMELQLPEVSLSYGLPGLLSDRKVIRRKIREGKYLNASLDEFVKPKQTKLFTGDIKHQLTHLDIPRSTPVWISEQVPFGQEYRFYVRNFINGNEIAGWARYDDLDLPTDIIYVHFNQALELVERVCNHFDKSMGPNAFSVDIGWRLDFDEFDLVEINDAWSLGLYRNSDSPKSPSNEDYLDMLISRWTQILFCNL